MKLRRRECWRRKMYLILCFRSEGVNEALAPGTPRVIWVVLTLINIQLSPDSALQCVLKGVSMVVSFSDSFCLHTHTHTYTEWNSFQSAETLHYLQSNAMETLGLAFLTSCDQSFETQSQTILNLFDGSVLTVST